METESKKKTEFIRTIKYALIAASAGAIQFGSFTILQLIFNEPRFWWMNYLISLALSVLWNFTFNRKYTFKSANNVPIAMLKVLAYYAVFTPISVFFGQRYLVDTLGWNEFLIEAIMMLINGVTEFLYMRFFVFGKSIDSAVKEEKKEDEQSV